jgi:hypothetical protein
MATVNGIAQVGTPTGTAVKVYLETRGSSAPPVLVASTTTDGSRAYSFSASPNNSNQQYLIQIKTSWTQWVSVVVPAGAGPFNVSAIAGFNPWSDSTPAGLVTKDKLSVNVLDYGAKGDGTTDDTAAINAAIAAAFTKKADLYLPPRTYKVSSALSDISSAVSIYGNGATLNQATASTSVLNITHSNVKVVGLTITGPGGLANDVTVPKAISIMGVSSASVVSNVKIEDCSISGFSYGVYARWGSKIHVRRCSISNVWNAGVLFLSVLRGTVVDNDVDAVNGPSSVYGIIASRWELGTTLSSDPRSADITIARNRVSNVTNWEGIDTHAGQRINIVSNTVTSCKIGIAVGCAQDTTNTLNTYAPIDCTVIGNTVDSGVTDGSAQAGISFTGASDSGERATGTIAGNVVRGHGLESSTNLGALYVHTTDGISINGNTIVNPSCIGISLYHDNRGFAVNGNTIIDVWTNTASIATCINLASTNNTGTIGDNTFDRGPLTGKTLILSEGLRVFSSSTNAVAFNSNSSAATTYITDAGRTVYTMLGRAKVFANTGTPEAVITAPAGSLYMNLNGGVGTTIYAKGSGSGNTGWVGYGGSIDASATLDFPSIAAGATAELTITATGATAGDVVQMGPPAGLEAGLIANARVSATNTVTIRLLNSTAGAIDPASATWKVRVAK